METEANRSDSNLQNNDKLFQGWFCVIKYSKVLLNGLSWLFSTFLTVHYFKIVILLNPQKNTRCLGILNSRSSDGGNDLCVVLPIVHIQVQRQLSVDKFNSYAYIRNHFIVDQTGMS